MLRVEVVLAWPRRFVAVPLQLADGATVGEAVAASGLALEEVTGFALHGIRADAGARLHDGDRIELLRPLRLDPKDARRRRAARRA